MAKWRVNKNMNISVMDYSFTRGISFKGIDVPGIIRYLRQLDSPAIEFMEALVDDQDFDNIQSALSETGTEVAGFITYCNFIDPDLSERQKRVTQLTKSLRRAAKLGAPHVTVVPGILEGDISPAAAQDWVSQGLRECIPVASDLGVILAIENLGLQTDVYGSSEHLMTICDSVGSELKLTYDAGNFLLTSEDCVEALDRIVSKVIHVHFKDFQFFEFEGVLPENASDQEIQSILLEHSVLVGADGRHYMGTVLGEGLVKLPAAVARLNELGYNGYISVEYEGLGDEPREAVRRGIKYLQSLLETTSK